MKKKKGNKNGKGKGRREEGGSKEERKEGRDRKEEGSCLWKWFLVLVSLLNRQRAIRRPNQRPRHSKHQEFPTATAAAVHAASKSQTPLAESFAARALLALARGGVPPGLPPAWPSPAPRRRKKKTIWCNRSFLFRSSSSQEYFDAVASAASTLPCTSSAYSLTCDRR